MPREASSTLSQIESNDAGAYQRAFVWGRGEGRQVISSSWSKAPTGSRKAGVVSCQITRLFPSPPWFTDRRQTSLSKCTSGTTATRFSDIPLGEEWKCFRERFPLFAFWLVPMVFFELRRRHSPQLQRVTRVTPLQVRLEPRPGCHWQCGASYSYIPPIAWQPYVGNAQKIPIFLFLLLYLNLQVRTP